MSVRWVFDPAPPSGKRTGGNAAEYSFKGRTDTLVREVIQNSIDARHEDNLVDVVFRMIQLTDSHLEDFLDGMEWASLQDNLIAVPETRGGEAIQTAMKELEASKKLTILVIEDRGTRGLEGDEQRQSDEERNSFCALVRDELYSDKGTTDPGGSFGLGKVVLWAYSSLKTVIFSSVPVTHPDGKSGVRFIGRASLPYHSTEDDGASTGDGWLGVAHDDEERLKRWAESVWGERAAKRATKCKGGREEGQAGLGAVIVGFSEPGEEDREPTEVVETIVDAALESFWPAIVRGKLRVEVRREYNDEVQERRTVDPAQTSGYQPAVDLLKAYDDGQLEDRTFLDENQSTFKNIQIEIPQRLKDPKHAKMDGSVALLVRLLEESDVYGPIRDRVFRMRSTGMVVRAGGGQNLSIAARPYVAVVLAGHACSDCEESDRVETFLRAAEPPEHDRWTHNTRMIKQQYRVHGCKSFLDRFDKRILEAIRELVSQPEERGGELPKNLLRHLRFGDRTGGGNPRFLSVTREKAWVKEGRWLFRAHCRRIRPDDESWHVNVHLKYAIDGGGGDDVHAISEVLAEGSTRIQIRNGVGTIEFPSTVRSASIHGTTDDRALPSIGTRAAVRLRIDGKKGGIPDA